MRRVLWNPWQGTGRPDTPSKCRVSCGRLSFFIRTTYPDRIGYRPECDKRECRVLLPEGVRLGERAPFHPDVSHPELCCAAIPPGCLTSGIFTTAIPPGYFTADIHPDILHPTPDTGWERRAFQLPRSTISGSSDSTYPESFATILHSAAVFS